MLTQHFVPKVTLFPLMIQDTWENTIMPLTHFFFFPQQQQRNHHSSFFFPPTTTALTESPTAEFETEK